MTEPAGFVITHDEGPTQPSEPPQTPLPTGTLLMVFGFAILIGVADAYLAFVIESPGTSLVGDCLLVSFVAASVATAGWWILRRRLRAVARVFVGSMTVVGVLAVW